MFSTLANIEFMVREYDSALQSARAGLQAIERVKLDKLEIQNQIKKTRKDLLDVRIRAQAKVQGQSAQTVRQELGHQSEYLKKATSINEVLSKHFRA